MELRYIYIDIYTHTSSILIQNKNSEDTENRKNLFELHPVNNSDRVNVSIPNSEEKKEKKDEEINFSKLKRIPPPPPPLPIQLSKFNKP